MIAGARQIPNLADFVGSWKIERVIDDRRAQNEGRFTGRAEFTPDGPDALIYKEVGRLDYANQRSLDAERTYHWSESAAGLAISFADGRSFHEIGADCLMPEATHLCEPDLYNVSYDFTDFPDWFSTWRVLGPRKDYRMISRYSRS